MPTTFTRLTWDNQGERFYETGIDHVVLYTKNSDGSYAKGVAWNGVTSINESPSGAEPTAIYADNIKYLNLLSNEEFALTIEALTYPDEFGECDGSVAFSGASTQADVDGFRISQQPRKEFALCYRSLIGNDTEGTSKGYKLHIVYNCLAAPTEKAHATVNDTPETMTMSWSVSTTPEEFTVNNKTYKAAAHVEIDSTKVSDTKMTNLLNKLYGNTDASTGNDPTLLTPQGIFDILNAAS